ncbi:hypothetical protein GH733_010085 [Mirounga leonina]|nr:hypothetical protein GH733_010085 [Mirounga leonina]
MDLMLERLGPNAITLPLSQDCCQGEQRNKGVVGLGGLGQVASTRPWAPAGSSSPTRRPLSGKQFGLVRRGKSEAPGSGKVGRRDREVGRGPWGPAGRARGWKKCPEPVLSLLAWPLDMVPELFLPSLLAGQAARTFN